MVSEVIVTSRFQFTTAEKCPVTFDQKVYIYIYIYIHQKVYIYIYIYIKLRSDFVLFHTKIVNSNNSPVKDRVYRPFRFSQPLQASPFTRLLNQGNKILQNNNFKLYNCLSS
jgi:hypothetical protein